MHLSERLSMENVCSAKVVSGSFPYLLNNICCLANAVASYKKPQIKMTRQDNLDIIKCGQDSTFSLST